MEQRFELDFTIRRETQVKTGKQWKTTDIDTDENSVKDFLLSAMIAKYVNKHAYITRITSEYLYNRHYMFTVYYNNGYRCRYMIKD